MDTDVAVGLNKKGSFFSSHKLVDDMQYILVYNII